MKKLWMIFGKGTPQKKHYCKAADELKINYEAFDVPFFEFKGKKFFYHGNEIKDLPDIVFIRCIDVSVELAVYNFFEKHNIRVINTKEAHKNCEDKFITYRLMKENKIAQPKTIVRPQKLGFDKISQKLGISFVVKSRWGSGGNDVCLVKDNLDFEKISKQIEPNQMLAQEYIKNSFGKELRTYIIDNKVVGAIFRTNKKDFRSNATGDSVKQTQISDNAAQLCVRIAKILKGEAISVDFLVDNDKLLFLEANVTPAVTEAIELGIPLEIYNLKYIMKFL